MRTFRKRIGYNLKKLRNSHNLSQEAMAERIKTGKGYISSLESGKRGLGKDMWNRIVEEFHIDYADLLKIPIEWKNTYGILREPEISYEKEKTDFEQVTRDIEKIFEGKNETIIKLLKGYIKSLLKITRQS